ncbi:hypothetical protein AMS68_001249 [Peltaster fructicola]|uniref:Brix domain-containing protein n=1 Tax=Peltaster fructicola TaxID=286661 RepID=A0A6H0XLV5_9PEZI|nr:hypothetical protein AMS68_001249 [Peltaster fructicola]
MVKRRVKKRTHVGANGDAGTASSKPGDRSPKSLVIRIGASDVGPSVTQLVHDVRSMMEPATASRLKERRNNRLRDYTSMAGPLGVTHLLLFSRSESGNVQFRLAISPRGPTFCFRVERYSLSKDVFKGMKQPKSGGMEYLSPPLLVMNNFNTAQQPSADDGSTKQIPKHLENLATTVFQSLFPPINPTTTPLKNIKRVLLLDRRPQDPSADRPSYILNLRHYAIETRTAKSMPKALRRLDAAQKLASERRKRGHVPNLGRLEDVSDYLLDPHAADGFTSGSDSEPETDAEVEILESHTRKVRSKAELEKLKAQNREKDVGSSLQRKGIKLHELGPRMRLRLTKVEEGLCDGKVMWHEWIHKTKEEQAEMEKVHQARRHEKERRRAEQKANVERKKAERKASGKAAEDDEDEGMDEDWEDDEYDETIDE